MLKFSVPTALLLTLATLACITPSSGQAATVVRTFVASTGNDSNACSRTAPCRTFGAAIAQTNAGGDVIVLDSAGYGPFTITKAINIVAPDGLYASVSQPTAGASAITVNAPGSSVVLRGLSITGSLDPSTGIGGETGINFVAGGQLIVEKCDISSFKGNGILFKKAGVLSVKGTLIRNMYRNNLLSYAINVGFSTIAAYSPNNVTQVMLDRCRMENNSYCLLAEQNSSVTARDCTFANSVFGIDCVTNNMSYYTDVNLLNCMITGDGTGIRSEQPSAVQFSQVMPATVRASLCAITGNNIGAESIPPQNGGTYGGMLLHKNNNLHVGNQTDTGFFNSSNPD